MVKLKASSTFRIRELLKSIFYKVAPPGSKLGASGQNAISYFRRHCLRLNRDYRKWIKLYDSRQVLDSNGKRKAGDCKTGEVKFSILLPVYDPQIDLFDEAIQSVREQTYSNWELCIADDASKDPFVKNVIDKHQKEDDRICVDYRLTNGNISTASNSALELATGDYVILFDHDDKLHPQALESIAEAIVEHPGAEIIYSDRDKITEKGDRYDPFFKPDFNYELLLRHNYISHLDVYKREIIESVGGFRVGFEGAQDYDLLLRVLEIIDVKNIIHVPKILYHWRASGKSVAVNLFNKEYAIYAGIRALNEHLLRKGVKGEVSFNKNLAVYQSKYELPEEPPLVEIILLSNTTESLKDLEEYILRNTEYQPIKITSGQLGEKNDSDRNDLFSDKTISNSKSNHGLRTLENLNQLIKESEAEIICLLDDHISEFSTGWLKKLVIQCLQERVGIVGPKLIDERKKVYSDGMILNSSEIYEQLFSTRHVNYRGYYNWGLLQREYSALSWECVLFSKKRLIDVGGFTENLSTERSAIIDLCLKMKAYGLRNIFIPSVILQTIGKSGGDDLKNDGNFFLSNWREWIQNDPAFNPNLVQQEHEIRINLERDFF